MILNTSEYCTSTTVQLEEKIQEVIDQNFKSQISLSAETESFLNVSGVALQGLVRYVEMQLEPALTMMIRKSWNTIDSVGDQSDFINQIGTNLSTNIQHIRKYLTSARFFKSYSEVFYLQFLAIKGSLFSSLVFGFLSNIFRHQNHY